MRDLIFIVGLMLSTSAGHAVDALFEFDNSLDDIGGDHIGTNYAFQHPYPYGSHYSDYVNQSSQYGSDGGVTFVSLGSEEYLGFTPNFPANWDINQPVKVSVRFRIDPNPTWQGTRPILTTHDGDRRSAGFTVQLRAVDDRYDLTVMAGDGHGRTINGTV